MDIFVSRVNNNYRNKQVHGTKFSLVLYIDETKKFLVLNKTLFCFIEMSNHKVIAFFENVYDFG